MSGRRLRRETGSMSAGSVAGPRGRVRTAQAGHPSRAWRDRVSLSPSGNPRSGCVSSRRRSSATRALASRSASSRRTLATSGESRWRFSATSASVVPLPPPGLLLGFGPVGLLGQLGLCVVRLRRCPADATGGAETTFRPQFEHCTSRPVSGITSSGISYCAPQFGQTIRILSPVACVPGPRSPSRVLRLPTLRVTARRERGKANQGGYRCTAPGAQA